MMRMTHRKKNLLYKIVALAFVILIALFPLEDSPSLENKTAVMVVAFDRLDDKTQIYVQMTIPQQLAQGSSKLLVVEEEGNNIAEAFERLSVKIGQEVELAHCGIIIIGENMAKGGFIEDLDYILSSGMISPQITLLNCEGKAADFMHKLNQFSQTNGSAVFDVAVFSENSINVRIISVLEFLSENNLPSNAAAVPLIDFEMQQGGGSGGVDSGGSSGSSGQMGGSSGGSGSSSSGGGGGQPTNPELKELNMAMMYRGGKAIGKMSPLATKGLCLFDKRSTKGYFEIDNVKIGDKVISYVPTQVVKKQGKLKARYEDGTPILTAEVDIKLEPETRFTISKTGEFASRQEVETALVERVKEIIKEEIQETLKFCIESGADVLGVETAFYKQCNAMYKIYGTQDDFVKIVQVEYKINVEVA